MWCIPPKQWAEFVYHMEDVLAVYHQPLHPQRPVVCLDETFQQLIGEVREPLSAQPGAVERYDRVYMRNGVASVFLAFEPLAGWRHVRITETRRRTDWAHFVESLLEDRYREAERVVLVMDQLIPSCDQTMTDSNLRNILWSQPYERHLSSFDCNSVSIRTPQPASTRRLHRKRPSAWRIGSKSTTRPSTVPG